MDLVFGGVVFEWRGPAPFHFVSVPEPECDLLDSVAPQISYGWGMIPGTLRIGETTWTTPLWPKDGGYVVPLKDAVRRAEDIALGDHVEIRLTLAV